MADPAIVAEGAGQALRRRDQARTCPLCPQVPGYSLTLEVIP
jgi:hypothetical protein